jgi:NAD(P)-dependent dehydrogenase (short-subunit alcohol dehydrogenase family)
MSLSEHVAVVAGATRGGGRAIAIELGAAGATVYVTGRSAGGRRSPMDRPETLEETAELVRDAGGRAVLAPTDHTDPEQVAALAARVAREQGGRLDLLVNSVWGGDHMAGWGKPFWEHDLAQVLELQRNAVWSHLITAHALAPLMVARGRGLVVEVTDGIEDGYRGALAYDLAKASAIRLALGAAADLRPHGVAALALTPGFLRSEAMLDHFGVTAASWRDAIAEDPHFAFSETPRFLGRAVVALARDPAVMEKSGGRFATWELAHEYGFDDVDGTRPDWGAHARAAGLVE